MRHITEAIRDFAARYILVFKAAWAARRKLDPERRTDDELAFLPAHLELVETPVSPLPRWLLRTLLALIAVAFVWACVGQLDVVAVAPGKAVVGSHSKIIQSPETAVVQRIHVQDGQSVRKGDLLVELDRSATAADYVKADEALRSATSAELRLSAMDRAMRTGATPTLDQGDPLMSGRRHADEALVQSQFKAFQARRDSLIAAIRERRAELATATGMVEPLAASARIAQARSADYAKLLEGNYVGRHDYLMREQERIAAERDLAAQTSRLAELRSSLSEAQEQLQVLVADTRQQTLEQLRQAREQISQFSADAKKAASRNRLLELRAPVDGTVQQLAIHTEGGVVTSAQPLMVLVPQEQSIEVEATVLNKDIGFVRSGQPVTVKIDSFPYTRFGYLTGVVLNVSQDAAQDEKLGLVFPARIRLSRSVITTGGANLRVTPGMSLTTEIKIGRRKLIDYVLDPVKRESGESFRER